MRLKPEFHKYSTFFMSLFLFLTCLPGGMVLAKTKTFYAEVEANEYRAGYIRARTINDKREKRIKITDKTKCFKKNEPRQEEFAVGPNAFVKGDIILVFSDNPDSPTPIAKQIWERKALLYKNSMVQIEKKLAGEITKADLSTFSFTIKTFEGEKKVIQLREGSRITINNQPGKSSDIVVGGRFAAICRWKGFEEDEPEVLRIMEILDNRSYVIQKLTEKHGPVIAGGQVQAVDMGTGMIKISEAQGQAKSVKYDRSTRWVPATPKIKKPSDFVSHNVLIFGSVRENGSGTAKMVLNNLAINSIFEVLIRQGDLPGSMAILAFGKLVSANEKEIVVEYRGQNVKCQVSKNTVFLKNNVKISHRNLVPGEQVVVKGILGRQPLAVVVISMGNVR